VSTSATAGLDSVRLASIPLVPEIQLHLAEDSIVWWARMEAQAGHRMPAPFWASAWLGGQALARYLLDHPELVMGRRVLDLAAGSGLVGIAAAMVGAEVVTANDIDPYALAATQLNARANGVEIRLSGANLLDGNGDGGDADLIVAGDVFYNSSIARKVMRFLLHAQARGAGVLVGDPGRADTPRDLMETLATYPTMPNDGFTDAEITHVQVLRPW
jgi:predicted nicotinamide N-methyase